MADNVTVTSAASYIVATDELSASQHVQYVKLLDGTADGAGVIPGGSALGLLVDVSQVQGTVAVGASQVGTWSVTASQVGTWAITASLATNTPSASVVSGQTAHDAAVTGNPVRVGGRAASAQLTAVADADAIDFIADVVGRQIIMPYTISGLMTSGYTATIDASAAASIIAAPGANIKLYVTHTTLTTGGTSGGTWANIQSGSDTLYTVYCAGSGGGVSATFPVPLVCAANEKLNLQIETAGASVRASATAYKGP